MDGTKEWDWREGYCTAITERLTVDERRVKKRETIHQGYGAGRSSAWRHQRGNAAQARDEVPFAGIYHGRNRFQSPTRPTGSLPLSLRQPRSRPRHEVAE